MTRKNAAGFALFSLCFVAGGAVLILMAYDYLPHGTMNAPPWVAAAAGMAGLVPGLCMLGVAIRGLVSPASMEGPQTGLGVVIATAFLTCLALALGGVVLFGDPRGFAGGLTGTAIEGRVAFSIAFLVVAALAAVFWLALIAKALSSRK